MRQAITNLKQTKRRALGQHAGLLLQRFLTDTPKNDRPEEIHALLEAACMASQSDSVRTLYTAAFERWRASFTGIAQAAELYTPGRIVVGLGTENVLETGLRLHHTYGTPLIPGSALKGLAAHYCHELWGQADNESAPEENRHFRRGGQYYGLLFGVTDDSGAITFHDAWIAPASLPSALRLDVMTPHHLKWQSLESAPSDFDSPTPVAFLSVAGTFHLQLSWSGRESGQAAGWTALALQLLKEALAGWGIGGKTRSGYGRLLPEDPARRNTSAQDPSKLPGPREKVETQLLEERTRAGGWKARHVPSGFEGPIQNTADVPASYKAGDTVQLRVAFVNPREIAFLYPTPTVEAKMQQPRNDPRKPPGRGPAGGRR